MADKALSGTRLIAKYVYNVFPQVNKELCSWTGIAKNIGDEMLRTQALSSISNKKFHCQGGSIYALYPKVNMSDAIRFIVSFQTISDYLDNLCDRAGVCNEYSFRQLHLSMTDAVDTEQDINDYYKFYPFKDDNMYLQTLVVECRSLISKLPSYPLVKNAIKKYIELYTDLQSLKHLSTDVREMRLSNWTNRYLSQYNDISGWEFCAATGSTLGVFVLYAAASDPGLTREEVRTIESAYFPWICGLHILLDYYIDLNEDLQSNDLNFTYYYGNLKSCEERLSFFVQQSFNSCSRLRYPKFHTTVVRGLLAMYLSDQKALLGLNRLASRNLTRAGGINTAFYHNLCRFLRFAKVL
jgi:tetraprenyl-beta-curcumene synthase